MVKITSITTKGGDTGRTHTGTGERLPKTHALYAALGSVDEANCWIGEARERGLPESLKKRAAQVQNDLFDVGSILSQGDKAKQSFPESNVDRIGAWVDEACEVLPPLSSFILPGGNSVAAALHQGRAVSRRAERDAWILKEAGWPCDEGTLRYLNRLSDLLFAWTRIANDHGANDVLWVPNGSPEA